MSDSPIWTEYDAKNAFCVTVPLGPHTKHILIILGSFEIASMWVLFGPETVVIFYHSNSPCCPPGDVSPLPLPLASSFHTDITQW